MNYTLKIIGYSVIQYMFFKNKVKNGKHIYNIENLNIKTNLDCMVFTSLLSISSSSSTNGSPQDVTTVSWRKTLALWRVIELTSPFISWNIFLETHLETQLHISWSTPFQLLFTGLSKYRVELSDLPEVPC